MADEAKVTQLKNICFALDFEGTGRISGDILSLDYNKSKVNEDSVSRATKGILKEAEKSIKERIFQINHVVLSN